MDTNFRINTIIKKIHKDIAAYKCTPSEILIISNSLFDLIIKDSNQKVNNKNKCSLWLDELGYFNSDNLMIRPYSNQDYALIKEWTKDEPGLFFLITRPQMNTSDLKHTLNSTNNRFGIIFHKKEHTPIGVMGFLDIDWKQSKAEIRKLIGEDAFRKLGYGKEATQIWLKYGFESLRLKKI